MKDKGFYILIVGLTAAVLGMAGAYKVAKGEDAPTCEINIKQAGETVDSFGGKMQTYRNEQMVGLVNALEPYTNIREALDGVDGLLIILHPDDRSALVATLKGDCLENMASMPQEFLRDLLSKTFPEAGNGKKL